MAALRTDAFPHGAFADAEVLPVLERLGLRTQVTRSAVVQSARSVESLAAAEPDAATRRARALLRYVDSHWDSLADDQGRFAEGGLPADAFVAQLRSTPWLPILPEPPHALLPLIPAERRYPLAPNSEIPV